MSNIFNDKKVAVTGKFNQFKRKDIEVRLVALGATISKSISKNTDILVAGEKAGSKLQKATTLGIDILDEAALMQAFEKIDSGSLAQAEQEAQEKSEKKAKPKELHEEIAAYLKKDREEYGLALGARLKLFFELLAKRSDLYIEGAWRDGKALSSAFGKKPSISSLNRWFKKLPTEYLAFLSEVGAFTYKWRFKEMGKQLIKDNYFQPEDSIGIFKLQTISRSPKWWPKQDWEEDFDYDSNLMLDEMANEGYAEYAYDPGEGPKDASITFMNHNDVERYYMGSLNSYLQEGAKNAFVWYWQVQSWTGQNGLDELKKRSIPSKISQKELMKQLQAKGCSEKEALALWKWLSTDAHILVALKDKV